MTRLCEANMYGAWDCNSVHGARGQASGAVAADGHSDGWAGYRWREGVGIPHHFPLIQGNHLRVRDNKYGTHSSTAQVLSTVHRSSTACSDTGHTRAGWGEGRSKPCVKHKLS